MKNDFVIRDGMATIELTQGRSMLAAENALPLLATRRWRAQQSRGGIWYAVTSVRLPDGRRGALLAHRLLTGLGFGDPREVDHWDGDGLNNTPSNLRVTDAAGDRHNLHGKARRDGRAPTSRYPGVYWNKRDEKWHAQIRLAGLSVHLGYFKAESDAAEVYVRAKAVRDAGGTEAEVRATRRIG